MAPTVWSNAHRLVRRTRRYRDRNRLASRAHRPGHPAPAPLCPGRTPAPGYREASRIRALGLGVAAVVAAGLFGGGLGHALPALAGGGPATGVVATGGGSANLRAVPSAAGARRGTVRPGTRVTLVCRVTGTTVKGFVRR